MKATVFLLTFMALHSLNFAVPRFNNVVCNCPWIWEPVCASNRKTFSNNCFFECDQEHLLKKGIEIVKLHNGICLKDDFTNEEVSQSDKCSCPKLLSPVCASNGKTYSNECWFKCNQDNLHKEGIEISKLYDGECLEDALNKEEEKKCACHKIMSPVCASNGKTYTNSCLFKCAQKEHRAKGQIINIVHRGHCKTDDNY